MRARQILQANADRLARLYPGEDASERYMALADRFIKHFGREPEMFVSAPGRTEVVGNHTDHNRGRVLAASVNLDTVAAIAPNALGAVRLYSEGYDEAFVVDLNSLDVCESEKETTWALIRGVAARLAQLRLRTGGFDAEVTSSVFKGSGLSSSAAFEVMLTAAFDALYNGWTIAPEDNAKISQYAENVYFGKPSGLLDQTASAVGGLVTIDFGPDAPDVEALQYDFAKKGYHVCVVSVGGDHGNLTAEYAAIPSEMKQVAAGLGREVLCGVDGQALMDALPRLKGRVSDRAILRAFHFVDETARACSAVSALKDDDLPAFFKTVIASGESSWKLLQNLYVPGSDNQEMPLALEMSRRMLEGRGAWRIHGGGFAGTILAFVPDDTMDAYAAQMNAVFGAGAVTPLSIRPEGAVVLR